MAPAPRKTTAQSRTRKSGAAPAVAADKKQTVESDTPVTVDSGAPPTGEALAVSPGEDMSAMERAEAEADAEDARQEAAALADAAKAESVTKSAAPKVAETRTASTVPDEEPAKITEGVYGPAGTKEEPTAQQLHGDTTPETQTITPEAAEAVARAAAGGEFADPEADGDVIPPLIDENHKAPEKDLEALRALADSSGLATPYPGQVKAPTPIRLPVLRDTYDWTREGDTGAVGRVLVDGFRVQCNGAYRFARKGDRVVAPDDVIEKAVKRGVMAKEG